MGKNNQWSKYTNEELIEMLRKILENNSNIKAVDFSNLGIPSVKTYKNILNLPNVTMKSFYNYFGLQHNPTYNCSGSPKEYTLEDMKNISSEQGFILLNNSFCNTGEIAHLKCKNCGELKDIKYKFFIYKPTRCLNCTSNANKLTYEQIKKYIEVESNSGCKLLETKESYKKKTKIQPQMSLCKIKFKCHCGNEFEQSFNSFKSVGKQECNECSLGRMKRGRSYEEIKHFIEIESNSGLILLSNDYKDNHTPLRLRCSCGNEFYRAFSEIKGTPSRKPLYKCKECTGATIQKTTEQVTNEFLKQGITLLSEYINYKSTLKIKYSCGFEVERTYANIIKSKYKCPHCIKVGYGRDTEQLKNEIDEITNGEYELISEYKTMNDKVSVKHNKCNNIYEVTPHNFIDSNNRCPKCGQSKGEIESEKILKQFNLNYKYQYSFDDLLSNFGNPLRFDFAIFDGLNKLSFLLEYDGEFHYKKIYDKHDFEGQKERDSQKDDYCKNNNIDLLRIPYWDFDNMEDMLKIKLKEKGLI